jgi:hypothetical protein
MAPTRRLLASAAYRTEVYVIAAISIHPGVDVVSVS